MTTAGRLDDRAVVGTLVERRPLAHPEDQHPHAGHDPEDAQDEAEVGAEVERAGSDEQRRPDRDESQRIERHALQPGDRRRGRREIVVVGVVAAEVASALPAGLRVRTLVQQLRFAVGALRYGGRFVLIGVLVHRPRRHRSVTAAVVVRDDLRPDRLLVEPMHVVGVTAPWTALRRACRLGCVVVGMFPDEGIGVGAGRSVDPEPVARGTGQ
ncbi:MAG: hypothetical protein WKF47_00655 [Geodermatophilaceae bacterium]